jgi:hypothetical protein
MFIDEVVGETRLDVSGFIQFADLCATQREFHAG